MKMMITGQDRLLKTEEGTRSDSIGNKSRTGAKADVGHLMKLATSNPTLSEPFRDTDDYVAVAANPRDWTSFNDITEPGRRSGDKSRKDTVHLTKADPRLKIIVSRFLKNVSMQCATELRPARRP